MRVAFFLSTTGADKGHLLLIATYPHKPMTKNNKNKKLTSLKMPQVAEKIFFKSSQDTAITKRFVNELLFSNFYGVQALPTILNNTFSEEPCS